MPPTMVRRVVRRRPKGSGFPINQAVQKWMEKGGDGLPGQGANLFDRWTKFYSCVDVPVGTAAINQFSFFTDAKNLAYTNIDQPGQIPANQGLKLKRIRVSFTYGFDRLMRRLGQDAPTASHYQLSSLNWGGFAGVAADGTVAHIVKAHEKMRELMLNGVLSFQLGNVPIFQIKDLCNFPSGRGLYAAGSTDAASNSATTGSTQHAITAWGNGAPIFANAFELPEAINIPGGQNFTLTIAHNKAVDFTETNGGPLSGATGVDASHPIIAGNFHVELEGPAAIAN